MNTEYEIFFYNMKKELGHINYHLYEIIKIYESLISGIDNFKKDTPEEDSEEEDSPEEYNEEEYNKKDYSLEKYNKSEKKGKNFLKFKFIEFLEHYNSKMYETSNLKNKIDNIIQENCEHTFIYDTIDSGLDNSMSIHYCTKCHKVNE
jgi:hypothetical protein